MAEGDVSIYYELKPVESSIQKSAEHIADIVNKALGVETSIYGEDNPAFSGSPEGGEATGLLSMILTGIESLAPPLLIIGAFFEAVGPIIRVVMKVLSILVLTLLMPVLKILLPVLPGLISALMAMANFISAFSPLGMIGDTLGNALGNASDTIGDLATKGSEGLIKLQEDSFTKMGEFASQMSNIIGDFISHLPQSLDIMLKTGKKIYDYVTSHINEIMSAVLKVGGQFYNYVVLHISESMRDIIKIGATFLQWVKTSQDAILGDLKDIGKWVYDSFTTAIVSGLDSLGNLGQWLYDTITKFIKNLIPTNLFSGGFNIAGNVAKGGMDVFDSFKKMFGFGDFISRPGIGIAAISPQDTVVGFKGSSPMGGSTVFSPTYNINGVGSAGELKNILEKINREQARLLRMKTSYPGGTFA